MKKGGEEIAKKTKQGVDHVNENWVPVIKEKTGEGVEFMGEKFNEAHSWGKEVS